jgi:polar amino acid transport system substrate-binding protein
VDFSSPYVKAGQHLLVPISAADDIALSTMNGASVGAQIGTAGAEEIKKYDQVLLKEYPEVGLALQDLVNGNLQGVVCDSPVAIDYALQNLNFKGKIKIAGDLMTSEDLGFAVRKGDAETLALLNSSLEAVKASGKLDEIKAKWGLK